MMGLGTEARVLDSTPQRAVEGAGPARMAWGSLVTELELPSPDLPLEFDAAIRHLRSTMCGAEKEYGMSIYRWSEDVILVDLPEELDKHHALQAVLAMLRRGDACDIVVDFSHVRVVGGPWLAQLRNIQKLAHENGHRLTLCGLAPALRGIFTIVHLDSLFEFAEDRFTALTSPQLVG